MLGACFHDTPSNRASPETTASVPERRHTSDAPVATDAPPEVSWKTGFDLYVSPATVSSWTLDGEVRTDRLPVRIRSIVPGQHTVEIDAPPGFQSERRVVDVQAGVPSEVHIDLKPAPP